MCVVGVEGSEKKCGPPRIIFGTPLSDIKDTTLSLIVAYSLVLVAMTVKQKTDTCAKSMQWPATTAHQVAYV